ncbi:hypothetical protein GA0061081_101251 [Gilliamella bombicola]|uniref:Uncharacterized protein n=1 Tax=Gilliamella bombicola TaxID=1798182 RepID=A0A1C3Z4X0_9GAMM|nr:hypothetical protein [Gilliamella bombicola]SCB77396.1 hypothetical protein GA0061081_101251 [Gilliamella bombicola]
MRYHGWNQTYALSLFQYHRSLKQTSSSLSKPSSLAPSSGLSSRFKLLSPLSKFSLAFAGLLLLPCSFSTHALSTYTSKVIEGSAPYLTFDGGRIKATSTDSLLSIKLQDGRVIRPSTNTSSAANPIRLPYAGSTLGDIDMLIPSSVNSVSLSDLVTRYNYWGDDDGDGQGANGITATGSISVSFTDKNGHTVSRSDTLDICDAPYKVTLSSTGGSLATQYGVPNSRIFRGSSAVYYINLNSQQPKICYARPDLKFGSYSYGDDLHYAGPANIWNRKKGFLVQSTSSSSYSRNFPTTAADGLYFDLDIAGVDGGQLTWSSASHGGITATVSWTRPHSGTFIPPGGQPIEADSWITDKSKNVTRVTIIGPKADSSRIQSSNPSSLTVPSLPQTFELVGRDNRGNEVKYGFVLRQWFINRRNKMETLSNQISWCNRLGYRLPKVNDLTNAKCGVDNSWFSCIHGIDGTTPSSGGNYYQRHIGAGFFTEWGLMYNYVDAGFVVSYYWAGDISGPVSRASAYDGRIYVYAHDHSQSYTELAVCTTP